MQDGGITSADESMREEMLKELFARFDNFMTSSIVENLKEEDMEEFIQMGNEGKSQEEIQKFITEKIPNAQDVFSQAMMDFRSMYLGNVTVKRNEPVAQAEVNTPAQQADNPTSSENSTQPN
jgi:hypothetical protein